MAIEPNKRRTYKKKTEKRDQFCNIYEKTMKKGHTIREEDT